jgi:hypothetical protein
MTPYQISYHDLVLGSIDPSVGSSAYESDGGNWVLEKSLNYLANRSGSEPVALPETKMSSSQNPVAQPATNPLTEGTYCAEYFINVKSEIMLFMLYSWIHFT